MVDLQQSFDCELKRISEKYNLSFKKIVAAVSGGADSLSLVFLLNNYIKKHNGELYALTVNHHLRPEANDETQYVAELMKKNNIKHEVLHWNHESLKNGIENKARQARYSLMFDWCAENNCNILMTAHHLRDQAETFLMRLQRGSGLEGLSAMSEVSQRENMTIVRPLLKFSPEELRLFLQDKKISWCEDASNQCDDFLRVRVRKMIPEIEQKLGITQAKIASAVQALNGAREYFAEQVEKFIKNYCRNWYGVAWSFSPEAFCSLHNEIKYRVLAELLKKTVNNDYSPEYSSINRVVEELHKKDFSGLTLGGCELVRFNSKIWVVPELQKDDGLSKIEWQRFVEKHPEVNMFGLPYKLKLYMVRKIG